MDSHKRIILHIDLDAFYFQVALLAHPRLRGRPVGIQQKNIVVTCSYEARARGVTKLQLITEARRRCPELVLVHGEDLAPFRAASAAILAVLRAQLPPGTPIERLVLEEFFVDATRVVDEEARAVPARSTPLQWSGHVHRPPAGAALRGGDPDCADGSATADGGDGDGGSGSSTLLLCVEQPAKAAAAATPPQPAAFSVRDECGCGCAARLAAGSALAWRLRRAVFDALGLTTSAGVGVSKLAAKAASGLHKPDDQTALLPWHTAPLLAPRRPVDVLPGVGGATAAALAAAGLLCGTVRDLAALPPQAVAAAMRWPLAQAAALVDLAGGRDAAPVTPHGPPASLSDEDTYAPPLTQWDAARAEVGKLVRGVLARVAEDAAEHGGRLPGTVKVTVRHVPPPQPQLAAAAATTGAVVLPPQPPTGSGGGGGGAAYHTRVTRQGPVPVTAFAAVRKLLTASSSARGAATGAQHASPADGDSASSSSSTAASISQSFQRQLQQSAASLAVVEPPSASSASSEARQPAAVVPGSLTSPSAAASNAQPATDVALSDEPLEAACWALFKRVVAETAPPPPPPPASSAAAAASAPPPPFCINLIGVTVSNFSASAHAGAAASSIAAFARGGGGGTAVTAASPKAPLPLTRHPLPPPPAASSSSSSSAATDSSSSASSSSSSSSAAPPPPACPPGVDASYFAALPPALRAEVAAAAAASGATVQPSKPRPPQQTKLSFDGTQGAGVKRQKR